MGASSVAKLLPKKGAGKRMGSSTDRTLDKTRPKQFRGMAEGRRVHFAFGRAQVDLRALAVEPQ
jgi:hypothetical protein